MARNAGSNEVFRLIHSLSVEKHGYFKKFAKRHTSRGNIYLKLFDAIHKQEKFEEISLKKKFPAYGDVKAYLKEMIMEAMVVYYRNTHSHSNLFNSIQQIHFLVAKGLHKEAVKRLEKAMSESRKMELFTIEKYLARLLMDLNSRRYNKFTDLAGLEADYRQLADENKANESNLDEFEILGLQWWGNRQHGRTSLEEIREIERSVKAKVARSQRAQIIKESVLAWIYTLQNETEKIYEVTEKQIGLVQQFRNRNDSSYYVAKVIAFHISNCIDTGRFDEAERFCNLMIKRDSKMKLYYEQAFVWGNLRKSAMYFVSGQFKKGLEELRKVEDDLILLLKKDNDALGLWALRVYYLNKICLLFANGLFRECWICIEESYSLMMQMEELVPSILMLRMMVQLEFGNFELLNSMAVKASEKFDQMKINDYHRKVLIGFFKKVSSSDVKQQAFNTWKEFTKYKDEGYIASKSVQGVLRYEHWLKSKFSDKSMEELMKKEFKIRK